MDGKQCVGPILMVGDVPLQASTSPNAGDEMLTCLCNYYASVGGAPEAYGSRRVCVCVCVCHSAR